MPVTRAIISIETNHAINQSKRDFKKACDLFLKSYSKIKNKFEEESGLPRGGSAMSVEELNQFIGTVDGYFKCRMAQIRSDYNRARIDNLKVQRKWNSYMGALRNNHKTCDVVRMRQLMHDVRNQL